MSCFEPLHSLRRYRMNDHNFKDLVWICVNCSTGNLLQVCKISARSNFMHLQVIVIVCLAKKKWGEENDIWRKKHEVCSLISCEQLKWFSFKFCIWSPLVEGHCHSKFVINHIKNHGAMNAWKLLLCFSCKYSHIIRAYPIFWATWVCLDYMY